MFIDKIKTEGVAHLSYILGDKDEAVVIDPRRDCDIYIEIATENSAQIVAIFETHRNEDFISGAADLAAKTGAPVYHGRALDFAYGHSVVNGDRFSVGNLSLEIIETPGHTLESISIKVEDTEFGEIAVAVFTGDALFVGDVGRTDFYPDREEEVAGMLYDSIFKKLLPLGDQAIIYPAHGAGSVCGDNMASREFSTIGYERQCNPALKVADREEFIRNKVNELHYKPEYFKKMEEYNKQGPPALKPLLCPPPFSAEKMEEAAQQGATLVDIRSPEAFAGAHIPGSLAIPFELLSAYIGFLVDVDNEIVLIAENIEQVSAAVRSLSRLGYDNIIGYFRNGMSAWEVSGRHYNSIGVLHAAETEARLAEGAPVTLLDVRKRNEFEESRLAGAKNIFLGHLQEKIHEIDRQQPVITFCGSGARAIVAASILIKNEFHQVENCFGSLQACKNINCRTIEGGG